MVSANREADRLTGPLGFLFGLGGVGASAAVVTLSDVAKELRVSATASAWVISRYAITQAVGTAVHGRIADVAGRRRALTTGVGMMGRGALLAAAAPKLAALLVARSMQGAGAGAVWVLCSSIVNAKVRGSHPRSCPRSRGRYCDGCERSGTCPRMSAGSRGRLARGRGRAGGCSPRRARPVAIHPERRHRRVGRLQERWLHGGPRRRHRPDGPVRVGRDRRRHRGNVSDRLRCPGRAVAREDAAGWLPDDRCGEQPDGLDLGPGCVSDPGRVAGPSHRGARTPASSRLGSSQHRLAAVLERHRCFSGPTLRSTAARAPAILHVLVVSGSLVVGRWS